jgi:hypothetical protein
MRWAHRCKSGPWRAKQEGVYGQIWVFSWLFYEYNIVFRHWMPCLMPLSAEIHCQLCSEQLTCCCFQPLFKLDRFKLVSCAVRPLNCPTHTYPPLHQRLPHQKYHTTHGGEVQARKAQYADMVNKYYDLATSFYEYGGLQESLYEYLLSSYTVVTPCIAHQPSRSSLQSTWINTKAIDCLGRH